MTALVRKDFILMEELNKTIVQSLASSFALDFLLFEDKKGGDVATVHNVREHFRGDSSIHLSDSTKQEYASRGDYKPVKQDGNGQIVKDKKGNPIKVDLYHTHSNYIERGRADKKLHQEGKLHDVYRNNNMAYNEGRQLDHIISSHEVHNDPGRVLAGLTGSDIANKNTNFQSTHSYINNLKSAHSMDKFLNEVVPNTIETKKVNIQNDQRKLSSMPNKTKEQQHKKRQLEDKIAKEKSHLETLESLDHEAMHKADADARKYYNQQINIEYYTSSKFIKNTGYESAKSGIKMGIRQALGIILAEVWFELKEHVPALFKDAQDNFTLELFLERIQLLAKNIWSRIKLRFKDLIEEFKNGAMAGAISSITTTILNIFFTTQKLLGRLIRETWSSLVSAAKLLFINPNKLPAGDLTREVIRILSTGVSVAMGVILNGHLANVMTFPFGTEIAAFLSAVATGLMTLGVTYFLDHSEIMRKVWSFLNQYKSEAKITLEYFQNVNKELDRFLVELTALEFNLSIAEMSHFTDSLESFSCEYEKCFVLAKEVERRGIELPFKAGDIESTRSWLKKL
ncbi:ATPase [Photobacterium damselae]|uniref:ATPase n=1 Tax=Photobacterium damselae TaxID=38293 RepID=UPI0040677C3A